MEVARLLATMENMALLDLSDELASMILNSEEAQNYKLAKEALLNDATSQKYSSIHTNKRTIRGSAAVRPVSS